MGEILCARKLRCGCGWTNLNCLRNAKLARELDVDVLLLTDVRKLQCIFVKFPKLAEWWTEGMLDLPHLITPGLLMKRILQGFLSPQFYRILGSTTIRMQCISVHSMASVLFRFGDGLSFRPQSTQRSFMSCWKRCLGLRFGKLLACGLAKSWIAVWQTLGWGWNTLYFNLRGRWAKWFIWMIRKLPFFCKHAMNLIVAFSKKMILEEK